MPTCPKCGGSRVETYLMMHGPMWCLDCNFRVEDKSVVPNPFLDAADIQATKRRPDPSPLGEALSRLAKAKRTSPAVDGEKPAPAGDLPAEE